MQNLRFAQTFMALLCPLTCILPSPMLILVYMITVWQYGCPDLILLSEQQTQISIYIQIYIESTYINDLPNIFPQQQDLLPQKKRHVASAGSDRPLLGSPGPSQDCLRSCHECRSAGVPSNERHVFLASSSFGRSGLEDVHTGSYRWGGYRDQVIGIQYVIVIVWHSSRSQWASAIAGPSWVLLNHCESTKQTKSL